MRVSFRWTAVVFLSLLVMATGMNAQTRMKKEKIKAENAPIQKIQRMVMGVDFQCRFKSYAGIVTLKMADKPLPHASVKMGTVLFSETNPGTYRHSGSMPFSLNKQIIIEAASGMHHCTASATLSNTVRLTSPANYTTLTREIGGMIPIRWKFGAESRPVYLLIYGSNGFQFSRKNVIGGEFMLPFSAIPVKVTDLHIHVFLEVSPFAFSGQAGNSSQGMLTHYDDVIVGIK